MSSSHLWDQYQSAKADARSMKAERDHARAQLALAEVETEKRLVQLRAEMGFDHDRHTETMARVEMAGMLHRTVRITVVVSWIGALCMAGVCG